MQTITTLLSHAVDFMNNVLVPLIFAVAFIVFLFGVFRYLIAGADNPEKRKTGGQLVLYSIIGFAIMISVWGLVNLVVQTFGFNSTTRPCLPTFSGNANCTNSSSGTTATSPTRGTSNSGAFTASGQPTE